MATDRHIAAGIPPITDMTTYLTEIRDLPYLAPEREAQLARAWQTSGDAGAANDLIRSHLRLVVRVAIGYRNYGLGMADLVAEGNLGLIEAVRRFDPARGCRLSTYAMWWIKAMIQDYVLRSWSMVRIGTTATQRKLFFGLRRLKAQIGATANHLSGAEASVIAARMAVSERDVVEMDARMSAPATSLDAPLGDGEATGIDLLADPAESAEERLAARDEQHKRLRLMRQALGVLNDRERRILAARRLSGTPKTLEHLARVYGVSRERIRQIEERAFSKLARETVRLAGAAGMAA